MKLSGMHNAKITGRVLSAAVLATGLTAIVSPGPAHAAIYSCQSLNDVASARGYCTGTPPSTFWIQIRCELPDGTRYYAYDLLPKTAGAGVWSSVSCRFGGTRMHGTTQIFTN
jgi:hypothetical protein